MNYNDLMHKLKKVSKIVCKTTTRDRSPKSVAKFVFIFYDTHTEIMEACEERARQYKAWDYRLHPDNKVVVSYTVNATTAVDLKKRLGLSHVSMYVGPDYNSAVKVDVVKSDFKQISDIKRADVVIKVDKSMLLNIDAAEPGMEFVPIKERTDHITDALAYSMGIILTKQKEEKEMTMITKSFTVDGFTFDLPNTNVDKAVVCFTQLVTKLSNIKLQRKRERVAYGDKLPDFMEAKYKVEIKKLKQCIRMLERNTICES